MDGMHPQATGTTTQAVAAGSATSPGSLARLLSWARPANAAASAVPALDGVRTLAVLLVLGFHAWFYQVGVRDRADTYTSRAWYLQTGVLLFFALSGYLLFQPYARWLLGDGDRPSVRRYLRRRALRVGPAYWVCLTLLVVLGDQLGKRQAMDWLLHAAFLHNLLNSTTVSINGVFWTMAVEVQYYVALPVLALGVAWLWSRLGPVRGTAAFLGLAALVSAASLELGSALPGLQYRPVWPALVGASSTSGFLVAFAGGMALCSVVELLRRRGELDRARGPAGAAWALGLLVALAAVLFVPAGGALSTVLMSLVYAAFLAGLVLGPDALRRPFEIGAVRFVGLTSYSFYLWHLVVLRALVPELGGVPAGARRIAVTFALALALAIPTAYVSYLLTERPFLAARQRSRDTAAAEPAEPVPAPAAAL
jgi:peptidoglycan/LPS O-acetylase OafA/YrhL